MDDGTEVGNKRRQTMGLWSEVVYDGMDVYRRLVILDTSGASGGSVYVE